MSMNVVLSDIHGNIQALEAVLAKADEIGSERIFCLGDLVGYGANPNEVLDLLQTRRALALLGNHDAAVTGLNGDDCFNNAAKEGVDFCRRVLTDNNMAWLRSLPNQLHPRDDVLMVHGSPWSRDEYLNGPGGAVVAADRLLREVGPGLCFFGHTHQPVIAWSREKGPGVRVMVNPGSVGQPRNRCPDAAFAVWDDTVDAIELLKVEYDVAGAKLGIGEAGLPSWLAERLEVGG